MACVMLLSLLLLGPLFALAQRRKGSPERRARSAWIAGMVPMGVSAGWALLWIALDRFHVLTHWESDGVRTYKVLHYTAVTLAVPLSFHLVASHRAGAQRASPLWTIRLALVAAFLATTVLCEATPASWTFTSLLIPPACAVMLLTFAWPGRVRPRADAP